MAILDGSPPYRAPDPHISHKLHQPDFSSVPPQQEEKETESRKYDNNSESAKNALSYVPPSGRSLLTTLHVLFPALVLPALDLLDRRLVTRVILDGGQDGGVNSNNDGKPGAQRADAVEGGDVREEEAPGERPSSGPQRPDDNGGGPSLAVTSTEEESRRRHRLYIVRSGQAVSTRRARHSTYGSGSTAADSSAAGSSSGLPAYAVHLDAWNCSCAGFAFAAYPVGTTADHPHEMEVEEEAEGDKGREEEDEEGLTWDGEEFLQEVEREEAQTGNLDGQDGWEFGGLSVDGGFLAGDGDRAVDTDQQHGDGSGGRMAGVPCCKHLLACLLADKWASVLGGHVEERTMEKQELAGLLADL